MATSRAGRPPLGAIHGLTRRYPAVGARPRKTRLTQWLRIALRAVVQLLIITLLLAAVWVQPVLSRTLVL